MTNGRAEQMSCEKVRPGIRLLFTMCFHFLLISHFYISPFLCALGFGSFASFFFFLLLMMPPKLGRVLFLLHFADVSQLVFAFHFKFGLNFSAAF